MGVMQRMRRFASGKTPPAHQFHWICQIPHPRPDDRSACECLMLRSCLAPQFFAMAFCRGMHPARLDRYLALKTNQVLPSPIAQGWLATRLWLRFHCQMCQRRQYRPVPQALRSGFRESQGCLQRCKFSVAQRESKRVIYCWIKPIVLCALSWRFLPHLSYYCFCVGKNS